MLVGVVCFDPEVSVPSLLLDTENLFIDMTPVVQNQNVIVYSSDCAETDTRNVTYWRASDRVGSRRLEAIFDPQFLHFGSGMKSGRWLEFGYDEVSESFRIAIDPMGLYWTYWAQGRGGAFYFSTDYDQVCRLIGFPLTVNRNAILLELAFGYVPGDETVYQEIRMLSPGTISRIDKSGFRIVDSKQICFGDVVSGLSDAEKFTQLDGLVDQALSDSINGTEHSFGLSLSAGYDSRYILGALLRNGFDRFRLFTFGEPASAECIRAGEIAKIAGRESLTFAFESGDWDQWSRAIRALGHTGTVQMCGWSERWNQFLKNRVDSVYIGYLGDALSGKHLGAQPQTHCSDWISYWIEWSKDIGWSNSEFLRSETRAILPEILRGAVEGAVQNKYFSAPHQVVTYLDLFGRQRRWVASQPYLVSRQLSPLLFFYHSNLMSFWLNLPFSDLAKQRLYLSYARSRFPKLFPRSERDQRTYWMRLVGRLKSLGHRLQLSSNVNPVLPVNREKIVLPNKDRILSLIESHGGDLEFSMDVCKLKQAVEHYPERKEISSIQAIRVTNLLILLSLRTITRSARHSPL